jgi:hypothetical protein
MIDDENLARERRDSAHRAIFELEQALVRLQPKLSEAELNACKGALGSIMIHVKEEIHDALWKKHKSLYPDWWREEYK